MPRCRPAAPPSIIADEHAVEAGVPPAWRRTALAAAPAAGRGGPRSRPVAFADGSQLGRPDAPEQKPSK
jgi:hypothetical protein